MNDEEHLETIFKPTEVPADPQLGEPIMVATIVNFPPLDMTKYLKDGEVLLGSGTDIDKIVITINDKMGLKALGCKHIYNCGPVTIYKSKIFGDLEAIECAARQFDLLSDLRQFINENPNYLYYSIIIRKDTGKCMVRFFDKSPSWFMYLINKFFVWKGRTTNE